MNRPRKRRHHYLAWAGGALVVTLIALAFVQIDDVVTAQGIVEPGQKIYVDSPLKRVLSQILAPEGTLVKAGDPVAQLYDGDLRAAVAAAEKEVDRSNANLELARAQLARLEEQPTPEELRIAESRVQQAKITVEARRQDLQRAQHLYAGERLWSKEDLEHAQTAFDLAQANLQVAVETLNLIRRGPSAAQMREASAEVARAETEVEKAAAALEAARESLDLATLRAPVDGVVARRDLHPGMLADQGQIVLIIAGSREGTVIDSWVHETNAWKIRLGQQVEILSNLFADREDYAGHGTVSEIDGYAVHDGGGRTFGLKIRVDDSPIPLRYGTTADLRIYVGRRSILSMLFGVENRDLMQASMGPGGDPGFSSPPPPSHAPADSPLEGAAQAPPPDADEPALARAADSSG